MSAPAAAGPTISRAVVGVEAGPRVHEIDARWLMAYAAALGEHDARYYDTTAAGGPAAHPLFPVCYEWPLALAVRARAIDEALAPLGVHATHRLTVHRPPRSGDRLSTIARLVGVEPRRAGALVTVRFVTVDAGGAPVTTTEYGSVYRGVGVAEAAPAPPPSARTAGDPGAAGWSERVEIPAAAAHVYTACARIENPIHTDIAVARAAGLPGLILHGTATLALALSRVVARECAGDPARVAEVTARFAGMVPMPSRLTVRGARAAPDRIVFDALDAAGQPVLAQGVVTTCSR